MRHEEHTFHHSEHVSTLCSIANLVALCELLREKGQADEECHVVVPGDLERCFRVDHGGNVLLL